MSKHRTLVACIFFTIVVAGCASNSGLGDMLSDMSPPELTKIDEAKLIYNERLRGYQYDGKMLFNNSDEKIRTKDEAVEKLSVKIAKKSFSSFEKKSIGEKTASGLTTCFTVPVILTLAIVNEVVLLPASPYTNFRENKRKKESFEQYVRGTKALGRGEFKEARLCFFKSLDLIPDLTRYSDVYYRIAETYDGEGQQESARRHYLMFINHSVALYPAYFAKYDESYKNDEGTLDVKFSSAEEKIKSGKP